MNTASAFVVPPSGGIWLREFGLTLTKSGPEFYNLPGATLAVKREGVFTIYEAAMPWRELSPKLPAAGAFSFGLFVNDSDGKGRRGYWQWADIKRLDKMQPFRLSSE